MSYYEDGLGSLAAGSTFPVGQQLVAGYLVASSAAAAQKLAALNAAMSYGFRGAIVRSGWGGPGAPGGVPAGSMWIIVEIRAPGISGATMNSVFNNVGQRLQSQLPTGSRVTNTHASTFGGTPSPVTPANPTGVPDPVTGLLSTFGLPGATAVDPSTGLPYGTMLPPSENFFTQSVGGIPMWGLLAGGTLAVGALGYVAMSKPKPKAVAANRRRRARRNRRTR